MHLYIIRLIWSFIFECPFCFVLLIHWLVPTFMATSFDWEATIGIVSVFGLTSNMLVKIYSDLLSLGCLVLIS